MAFFIDGKFELVTKFYTHDRDSHLKEKCEEGDSVDTISIYSLTPGTTSSFKALRACSEVCTPEQSAAIKLYKGDESAETPLDDPFIVFKEHSENNAVELGWLISLAFALLLLV